MLKEALLCAIISGTSEASEIDQQGHFVQWVYGCLGGEVEVEGHLAISSGGIVSEFEEFAPEGGDCCFRLYRHCG